MRIACIAFVLSLVFIPAGAFEIEATRSYPAAVEGKMLSILSTADVEVFEPIIFEFQKRHPDIAIDYVVASSAEVSMNDRPSRSQNACSARQPPAFVKQQPK